MPLIVQRMTCKILVILTFLTFFFPSESKADEIWKEDFSIPEKGVWGDEDGVAIHFDLEGISQWGIFYDDIILENPGDYFKTVATSGGRFEAVDINGEAVWFSELINIEAYKNVEVAMKAAETGSGNNQETKYLKAYYKLDGGEETLFAQNGTNLGNFGSVNVKQEGLQGESLQIIVKFSTHYASDKVYMDDVTVSGDKDVVVSATKINIINAPGSVEKDDGFSISAEIVDDGGRRAENYSGTAFLEGETFCLSGTLEAGIVEGFCQWDGLFFTETGEYILTLSTPTDDLETAYHTIVVMPPSDLLFFDDFESGLNEGYNPQDDWEVSETDPLSGFASLKHKLDTVSGESHLFYPINIDLQKQNLEWGFTIKNGDWDPSSSNKFWVYLAATSVQSDGLTGYALGVNLVGSNDLLSLWRLVDGRPDSLIVETDFDWDENQMIKVKVTRSARGLWEVQYNLPGTNDVSPLFYGEDCTNFESNYWGLYYKYTSTRAGKFWFDDISIKAYDSPPFIANVQVLDGQTIQVVFNEEIILDVLSKSQFILETGNGNIIPIDGISFLQGDQKNVRLKVTNVDEFDLSLTASNFSDLGGNTTNIDSFHFLFLPPVGKNDLVVNEIMADPSPVVGLPEDDFIELYNRAAYPLKLEEWSLLVNDTERPLDEIVLLAGEYLVLCKTGDFETFMNFGKAMAVTNFPALPVAGASVKIKAGSEIIDAITYSKSWYGDEEKENGGWSLERVDPNRNCGQEANWVASMHPAGGTPGQVNSVLADNPDLEAPYMLWANCISPSQVEVQFSEPMALETLGEKKNFSISDGMGVPDEVVLVSPTTIWLAYASGLMEDKIYQLDFQGLTDDCGNALADLSANIQWVRILPGDVAINEVLYDPYPDGEDFVELYNNSEKMIPLNRVQLASRDENWELEQIFSVSSEGFVFEPHSYLACTKNKNKVLDYYYSECPQCILGMPKFPTYTNGQGVVVLMADSTEIVDEFSYSDALHSPFLADAEGISLERVAFGQETNNPSTWQSAAEHVGYATPGYQNSQFEENRMGIEVTFEPKSISPNNDGYHDQLHINYQLDGPGYVANIWVFDVAGRAVGQLAQNELLGTSGTIAWEGEDETGSRLPLGAYIILVELFDAHGHVKYFKEACILTDVLD